MKIIQTVSLILFISVLLFSCSLFGIQGSGNIVESQYTFTDFTSVNASHTCDVTIVKGDTFSIVVSVDDNIVPHLETYVSGNTLNIDLESGYSYNNIDFKATVVMPQLSYINISGASEASVSGFENSGDFQATISGASKTNIDFISSQKILCDVSGASKLTITSLSSSGDINIECSGASKCDLRNISADNGTVDISGASTAYVYVSGSLSGEVSGASELYYSGTPATSSIDISGASEMTRL